MGVPVLRALDLGRRVGGAWLWRNLTFQLSEGEIAVLRGPSGVGKSLLYRVLVGLDRPDEGAVQFRGEPATAMPAPMLRTQVLYCPQRPLVVPGTVRTNLEVPRRFAMHGVAGEPRRVPDGDTRIGARAEDLFSRLGKDPDFLERAHDVLSGGEEQLVSLVRALLLDPVVLLLDEPTAGLDEAAALSVEQLVGEWVKAGDRAVMWTGHDARQTERVRQGPAVVLGGPQ
jgi:UDP-glucose/iron transport system ATP-binding protein